MKLVVDDFVLWCAEQERKKTAFLPSLRVGGKFQHVLNSFLHRLLRMLLPEEESASSYSMVTDNTDISSIFGDHSIAMTADSLTSKRQKLSHDKVFVTNLPGLSTIAQDVGESRSTETNCDLYTNHSAASAHYGQHTVAFYKDATLSVGSGPLYTDRHFRESSLPVCLLPIAVADTRLLSSDTAVAHSLPSLQQQLTSFCAGGIATETQPSSIKPLLYKDMASLLSAFFQQQQEQQSKQRSTNSTFACSAPVSCFLPESLAQHLRDTQTAQKEVKKVEIAEAKHAIASDTRSIKAAHRRANESTDLATQAEATQLLPIATYLASKQKTQAQARATQAAQSLLARTDGVPLSRDDFALLLSTSLSSSFSASTLQRSKGNSALFPQQFRAHRTVSLAPNRHSQNRRNPQQQHHPEQSSSLFETLSERFIQKENQSEATTEEEYPQLLDLAVAFASPVHRLSVTETGLGVLGAANSGLEADTHLCRDTRNHLRQALSLLQSRRLMKRAVSSRVLLQRCDEVDDDDEEERDAFSSRSRVNSSCIDDVHTARRRLRLRRPHQPASSFGAFASTLNTWQTSDTGGTLKALEEHLLRDKSQVDASRHSCDTTAMTARDMAHLYHAHSLPICITTRARGKETSKRLVSRAVDEDESLCFQLLHDLHSVCPSVSSSGAMSAAAGVSPELVNLVLTQARDKLQRLLLRRRRSSGDVEAEDTLSLLEESLNSSAAVAIAVSFDEICTSMLRHWRHRCEGTLLEAFCAPTTTTNAASSSTSGGADENGQTRSATEAVDALLRSQATHSLLTPNAPLPPSSGAGTGALNSSSTAAQASVSRSLHNRVTTLSTNAVPTATLRKSHTQLLRRYLTLHHPLYLGGKGEERVYFESDRRYLRLCRLRRFLPGVSIAAAQNLRPPRGLRVLPVGSHTHFLPAAPSSSSSHGPKTAVLKRKLPTVDSYSQVRVSETLSAPTESAAAAAGTRSHASFAMMRDESVDGDGDSDRSSDDAGEIETETEAELRRKRKKKLPKQQLKQVHRPFLVRFLQAPLSSEVSSHPLQAQVCEPLSTSQPRDARDVISAAGGQYYGGGRRRTSSKGSKSAAKRTIRELRLHYLQLQQKEGGAEEEMEEMMDVAEGEEEGDGVDGAGAKMNIGRADEKNGRSSSRRRRIYSPSASQISSLGD